MTRKPRDQDANLHLEVKDAVASVAELLREVRPAERRYELRQDLAQELAIKLWRGSVRPEGLRTAARNWVIDWKRHEAAQKATERESAAIALTPGQRRAPSWKPDWYSPHKDAEQFAPFACEGARLIHVQASCGSVNVVENELISWIDTGKRNARDRKRLSRSVSSHEGR